MGRHTFFFGWNVLRFSYLRFPLQQRVSVIFYVADRSLIYFLSFLIVIVTYCFYNQYQYGEELHKLASEQDEIIRSQQKALSLQRGYIKLLEVQLINDFYKNTSPNSPVY